MTTMCLQADPHCRCRTEKVLLRLIAPLADGCADLVDFAPGRYTNASRDRPIYQEFLTGLAA